MRRFIIVLSILATVKLQAQNVGIGTSSPNASTILDVSSTSKGLLLPRMSTTQRNAIVSPAAGLQIFNTDEQCVNIFYQSSGWFSNYPPKPSGTAIIGGGNWVQKKK